MIVSYLIVDRIAAAGVGPEVRRRRASQKTVSDCFHGMALFGLSSTPNQRWELFSSFSEYFANRLTVVAELLLFQPSNRNEGRRAR